MSNEDLNRKPKYNPDGNFIRLDQVQPGDYAEIFLTDKQGFVVSDLVKVKKHQQTKQERNPMVVTSGGQVLGGGTSARRSS